MSKNFSRNKRQRSESLIPRDKRVPAPLSREEFVQLRNFAAKRQQPMSRVLLEMVAPQLAAISRGEDPLQTGEIAPDAA